MRHRAIVLLITCLFSAAAPSQEGAESELRAAMAQRLKASLAGDSRAAADCMTDDYLQTDISGHVQDKATWFREYFDPLAALIKAGKFRWETFEQKDLQFRIYGESAVVMGRLDAKGTGARFSPEQHAWVADPNAGFSGTLRFTHVYVKRNGRWLLAALQNAVPVGPPAK